MCVSGSEPRSRRRSESELCTQAAAIALPTHEKQLARTTGADLRAELPFDLMVKAAPVFAVTYMGALLTLWDLSIAGSTNAWIGPLPVSYTHLTLPTIYSV